MRFTVPIVAVVLLLAGTARATPQPVTAGSLTWSQVNVHDTAAPAGTNRTWLGYTTAPGPPFTNGTMTAASPATGPTVTPGSARGVEYETRFPVAAGGTYDPDTERGVVHFAGTLTYASAAHGFTIAIADPRVVFSAAGAQLFANGNTTEPVFDLGGAATEALADGRRITGLAPAVATAGLVWPAESYPRGSGPDRTPNTFGGFALEVHWAAAGEQPPAQQQGPAAIAQVPDPAVRRPIVRCRPTRDRLRRTRTTCDVRLPATAERVAVLLGAARLVRAEARDGVATVSLPRKRRRLTFVALDSGGRKLSRRVQLVGG